MRNYILNIVRAVLGLSNEEAEDKLFEAVDNYFKALYEPDDCWEQEHSRAFNHLQAMYEWYKEQE